MVVPRLVAAGDIGQVDFEREGHQLGDHLGAEPFFPPNFSAAGNCSTQLSTTANFLPGVWSCPDANSDYSAEGAVVGR